MGDKMKPLVIKRKSYIRNSDDVVQDINFIWKMEYCQPVYHCLAGENLIIFDTNGEFHINLIKYSDVYIT